MTGKLVPILAAACGSAAAPAAAQPLAETLVGTWTCEARENAEQGATDVAMVLTYQRSDDFMIGEIKEDNGAALVDVWLDDGNTELSLRRVLSHDATIEMHVVEAAPDWVKLEGEMRHVTGATARVREEYRFIGSEEFRAIWEADSGEGWKLIMDRTCKRI